MQRSDSNYTRCSSAGLFIQRYIGTILSHSSTFAQSIADASKIKDRIVEEGEKIQSRANGIYNDIIIYIAENRFLSKKIYISRAIRTTFSREERRTGSV